jgi:hypothetical protein
MSFIKRQSKVLCGRLDCTKAQQVDGSVKMERRLFFALNQGLSRKDVSPSHSWAAHADRSCRWTRQRESETRPEAGLWARPEAPTWILGAGSVVHGGRGLPGVSVPIPRIFPGRGTEENQMRCGPSLSGLAPLSPGFH